MELRDFFQECPKVALGFSGGVDSAYLLWAGRHWGCDLTAYYVRTAFQPEFEYEDARRLAEEVGVPLRVVEADIYPFPWLPPTGRTAATTASGPCSPGCGRQAQAGTAHTLLLDGTNASDDAGDRPGMRALGELSVRSPLRECGAHQGPGAGPLQRGGAVHLG